MTSKGGIKGVIRKIIINTKREIRELVRKERQERVNEEQRGNKGKQKQIWGNNNRIKER